jgi:hypothetical protein
MNYHQVAQRFLQLFREARARGPRHYGANTGTYLTGERDLSSIENPRSNAMSKRGLRPGRGRDKKNPTPPIPPMNTVG